MIFCWMGERATGVMSLCGHFGLVLEFCHFEDALFNELLALQRADVTVMFDTLVSLLNI